MDVPTIDVVEPPPLDETLVRPWLLPEVYDRLRAGRGEFLAELRPAYPVFLRFAGIDYDDDPEAIEKLDGFVRQAQRIMAGYGGNVLQLTLGDKGAYLYGVFGSPVAHEDDAARAATAALELRDLERTTDAREIQIGVDARPAPKRHLRPRDAPHVRLPGRRGEPVGATDVGRSAGTDLRRRPHPPGGR